MLHSECLLRVLQLSVFMRIVFHSIKFSHLHCATFLNSTVLDEVQITFTLFYRDGTIYLLLSQHGIPYTQKFSQYEIFAEQEANRIFTIIFLWITGPSWKGSMCYVLLQISNCCKLANFHRLNFCCIRK